MKLLGLIKNLEIKPKLEAIIKKKIKLFLIKTY